MEIGSEINDTDICCYNCKHMTYMEVTGVLEEYCSKNREFTHSWNKCKEFNNRWKNNE